jgi:hypothetical protein
MRGSGIDIASFPGITVHEGVLEGPVIHVPYRIVSIADPAERKKALLDLRTHYWNDELRETYSDTYFAPKLIDP